MDFEYFSRNGKVLPIEKAVIPLSNIGYQYGYGVYESIRVSNGAIFFLDDHVERLVESARIIGLEHSFAAQFVGDSIRELAQKTEAKSYNLKVLLIGSNAKKSALLYILCLNPLFPDKKLYREGVKLITHPYERSFPHAKTLNMLESYLAYKKAKESGAYDALLINNAGHITEGTRTNFFCMKGKTIFTPNENEILLGVTRKAVLKVARENNSEVVEQNISAADLENYDGAFITSTSSKIVPIRSIDAHVFNAFPPALHELMRLFDEFLATCKGTLS